MNDNRVIYINPLTKTILIRIYDDVNDTIWEDIDDLLAQKEDRKELTGVSKQRLQEAELSVKFSKPTPSPLGGSPYPLDFFEEIEEITELVKLDIDLSENNYINIGKLADKVNSLIRNQKKLYQYIKKL